MKKIAIGLLATCLSLTLLPLQINAATNAPLSSVNAPKPVESAEARVLLLRLDEISKTDASKLNSAEKKDMKKEVRSIKRELKDINGGVYISAGALILILILMVILL